MTCYPLVTGWTSMSFSLSMSRTDIWPKPALGKTQNKQREEELVKDCLF